MMDKTMVQLFIVLKEDFFKSSKLQFVYIFDLNDGQKFTESIGHDIKA